MDDEAFDKILTALRDEMRNRVLADLECDKLRSSLGAQRTEVLALQNKLKIKDSDAAEANRKFERYVALWKSTKSTIDALDAGTSQDLPALRAAVQASADDCIEIPF